MAQTYHTPVMVEEVLDAIRVKPGGTYVDCTVGGGGHAAAVIGAVEPAPRLLGLDLDPDALEVAGERLDAHGTVVLAQANFADLGAVAREHGFDEVDGVLFDLGLSSLQVDTAERGFSFRLEAPLNMAFDRSQRVTAHHVVNRYDEAELADVIYRLGEEPRARRIARAIVGARPIETTTGLAQVVARASGRTARGRIHPATRTFQAIRMAVNGELDNLDRGLDEAIGLLASEGRLVVIAYHSLEDRLAKTTLRREASECVCPPGLPQCVCGHVARIRLLGRRVVKPTPAEVEANPRSRSARMRAAERL